MSARRKPGLRKLVILGSFLAIIPFSWTATHINGMIALGTTPANTFLTLSFEITCLWWFCFIHSEHAPSTVHAFAYAFVVPFVTMFGVLVTAEANAGDTDAITPLLDFAETYQKFVLDPLPEARILMSLIGWLLVVEVIVRILTSAFGINRRMWIFSYAPALPKPIYWLVKIKLLQGFDTSGPQRSYLHYIVGAAVMLTAKGLVAFSGGGLGAFSSLLIFPHRVVFTTEMNLFIFTNLIAAMLGVGGTAVLVEIAGGFIDRGIRVFERAANK